MITGEVYDEILIDGIHIGRMVCLTARTPQFVIAWRWTKSESIASWQELMDQLPAPAVVVCDGGTGMATAIKQSWQGTKIQQCHFHVQAHVRTKLTMNPGLEAGRRLAHLTKNLSAVATIKGTTNWMKALNLWYQDWSHMLKERTYISTKTTRRRWEYTHKNLPNAYFHLEALVDKQILFTYLEPEFAHLSIDRTTNYLEGGINSQLRTLLKAHRGMPFAHQQRLVEWYLHSRTEFPLSPKDQALQSAELHQQIQHQAKAEQAPDIGQPALYDTGLDQDFQWTTTS